MAMDGLLKSAGSVMVATRWAGRDRQRLFVRYLRLSNAQQAQEDVSGWRFPHAPVILLMNRSVDMAYGVRVTQMR
jgi:hypothetical protein